jgi:prevent-host-death family protein
MNVNIHAAKTNLSRLIEKVSLGETIIISKAGKPLAKLAPYDLIWNKNSNHSLVFVQLDSANIRPINTEYI